MKCNAWTNVLMAAGLVSLPAVLHAEEKPSTVLTALSGTTLSGYVDTSAHWNFGTGNANLPAYTPNGQLGGTKADGFNLDVVALTLSHPVGEGDWSAGYNATLLFGPDAAGYNPSFTASQFPSDFSLKDTYVVLHAPVGNGLDVKIGTYTEILGYEVYETGNNPNYTRSYGYMIEPTQMTGVLGTYQLNSALAANAGICDVWSAGVNSRAFPAKAESFKTYMGSLTFTAPTNMGFLAGSTVSGGIINGYDAVNGVDKTSWYIGGTFNTPIKNVKVGVAHDYVNLAANEIGGLPHDSGYQHATGLYLSWQATEKLTLNTRGEYLAQSGYLVGTPAGAGLPRKAFEVTETVQYDLWRNVLARVEFRWDHAADSGDPFSNGVDNAFLLAANIIYKF
ncbi:MAG TPA: outer membrane beta-barrel protein [Verrucomicrobiae bacterium]